MSLIKHGMFRVPNHQQGFTLIEILVAVLVLTIGLLGLAGLQATTMRFNHSAYMRSQATNLAYDIADRMRVNRAKADDGDYDGAIEDPPPACTTPTLTGDLANQDIQEWRNALACTLPSGTGNICRGTLAVDGTCTFAPNVFTIRVQWDDSRDSSNPQQFDMTTDL